MTDDIKKLLIEKNFVIEGVSGIDSSGKGFLAKRLQLQQLLPISNKAGDSKPTLLS